MYISRVEINPYRRETVKALLSPQVIHAAVMASFPSIGDSPGRIMWRIDKLGCATYIIVQSDVQPDFNHIIDQFGYTASGRHWDTREYDSFLSKIENGQTWRFRIKANPTYSLPSINGQRGKVVAHVTAEQQTEWFKSKSVKCGFSILENSLCIKHRDVKTFRRGVDKVTIATVTFEGVLNVEDADLMRKSMIDGIGRAKAYGCGLLTLARV